jgi:transcriptional regulator with XRE-family HTH domain
MKSNWLENKLISFHDDDEFILDGIMLNIAENVSIALKKTNMSKGTFAKELGVSPAYITKLLRGEQNLTVNSLYRISKIFNMNITGLFKNPATIKVLKQPSSLLKGNNKSFATKISG